jgi:hypothetical protein
VYTVHNSLTEPITVTALQIGSVVAPAGCPAANLDLSQTTFSGSLDVPGAGSATVEVPISMIESGVNQDACKNVTFGFAYSGTATYAAPTVVGTTTTTTASGLTHESSHLGPQRIAGGDRITTAIAGSRDTFAAGGAGGVAISRADLFPDALAGTPLAVRHNAPMLLTLPTVLDPRTENEVKRVLPTGGVVYVLGGTAAVSDSIVRSLTGDGYRVMRIGGSNRFATAVAIARILGTPADIILATGTDGADAVAGGAAAAKIGGVVVLTNGRAMPAETSAYLATERGVPRYALGGPATTADPSATALVGTDRYATSVLVAERFFVHPTTVGFAGGFAIPDALSGGTNIGSKGGPLILVAPAAMPETVRTYLHAVAGSVVTAIVYGGTSVVPDSELSEIDAALHGQ